MGTAKATALVGSAVAVVGLWLAAALLRDVGCCSNGRVFGAVALVVVATVAASTAGASLALQLLGLDRLVHHVAQPTREPDATGVHRQVLDALTEWPGASTAEIAERTGRTRREVEVAIDELLAGGRVERRWGGWHRRDAAPASGAPTPE